MSLEVASSAGPEFGVSINCAAVTFSLAATSWACFTSTLPLKRCAT